jgi:hypothetical protein
MCTFVNMKVNNDTTAKLQINTDVGGSPGETIIWLFPLSPNGGTDPGSFPAGAICSLCNFSFGAPVEYVG